MKKKTYKVSKGKAIQIAMNHNCVSRDIAERYTDSELKEVLRHLNMKGDFQNGSERTVTGTKKSC